MTLQAKILAEAAQETPVITPEGAERRVLSYGPGLMLVEFTFKPGIVAPMHSHPHEQVGYIVSGALELTMDGHGTTRLGAGGSYYVPPGTMHGVTILEPTVLVDAFTPVRDDFLG